MAESGPEKGKFPSWKQALITFFGGIVLAGTSCFGFLVSLGGNFERGGDDILTPLAAIVFCVSLLVILVGFIFIILRALRPKEKPPLPPQTTLPPEPPTPGAPV
jgi:O-antigen/teichoic acid export membrane protein